MFAPQVLLENALAYLRHGVRLLLAEQRCGRLLFARCQPAFTKLKASLAKVTNLEWDLNRGSLPTLHPICQCIRPRAGTSAVMAALHAKGELQINEEVIAEGIAGGFFKGRLLSKAELNGMPAVIPEITGPAVLTGMHQFFIDPADPLRSDLVLT